LRAARQMGYRQSPVLGVNLGRLGFLADIHPQEFETCFQKVLKNDYRVTRHLMYECIIADGSGSSPPAPRVFLGLNEVVVHAGPTLHMLDLRLEVDGVQVAHFSGDGLIVSTPVGSTAHNLSAGGPILGQELAAFALTPICPHTLTYRPVVDSADKVYTIHVGAPRQGDRDTRRPGEGESAVVIIDGQMTVPLTEGQRVVIRRAPVSFGLVKMPERSFFQTLRDKLRWGAPPNYRGEP